MTAKLNGLEIQVEKESAFCHIHEFTEEIKSLIRNHLSNICHGRSLAEKGLAIHSYKNTLQQFRNRYHKKSAEVKKGLMGELLAHIFLFEFFDDFEIISPFFNMEEKSQRKGFDVLLVSKSGESKDVWITEVKSGEIGARGCPDRATRNFLHTAKRDLNRRLNQAEDTFWLNAINTVSVAISDCKDFKEAIIKILSDEGELAANDQASSRNNNVILTSVLFHGTKQLFDAAIPKEISESIEAEDIFNRVITFSIQKEAYQLLEVFLFQGELDD